MRSRSSKHDPLTLLPGATAKEQNFIRKMRRHSRARLYRVLETMRSEPDEVPLRLRVLQSSLPMSRKKEICAHLATCKNDEDYQSYVQRVLTLPRSRRLIEGGNLSERMTQARATLDGAICGQEGLKDVLMQVVSERMCSPHTRPTAIGIQGPAGNGKTTMIRRGLAAALDLPFFTVALGGMSDASHLLGFDRTYTNATHGRLASISMEAGCTNPIVFFDELDKVADSSHGREIVDVLIHLTDPEGCDAIHDRFLGPVDLSSATLVFAFNDETQINPILRNRLRVVRTQGYDNNTKAQITHTHILPRLLAEAGADEKRVRIGADVVDAMVARCADEQGVRQLRQSLASVVQRAHTCASTDGAVSMGVPPQCVAPDGGVHLYMPEAESLLALVKPETKNDRPPGHMYT